MKNISSQIITRNLAVYGFTHAIVDASCVAVLFSMLARTDNDTFFMLAVAYSVLAFGLQVLIGIETDKRKIRRRSL